MSEPDDPSESPKPLAPGVPLYGENLAILLELAQILGDVAGDGWSGYVGTGDAFVPQARYGTVLDFDRLLRKRLKDANPSVGASLVDAAVTRSSAVSHGTDHFVLRGSSVQPTSRACGHLAACSYWRLGAVLESLKPSSDELAMAEIDPEDRDYYQVRSAYLAQSAFPLSVGRSFGDEYAYVTVEKNIDSQDPDHPYSYDSSYDSDREREYKNNATKAEERAMAPGAYGQAVARHAASSSFGFDGTAFGRLAKLTPVPDPRLPAGPSVPEIAVPCAPDVAFMREALADFASLRRAWLSLDRFSMRVVGPHRYVERLVIPGKPDQIEYRDEGELLPSRLESVRSSSSSGDTSVTYEWYVEADGSDPEEPEPYVCGTVDLNHPWLSKWIRIRGLRHTVAARLLGSGSRRSVGETRAADRAYRNESSSYKDLTYWWLRSLPWTYVGQCEDQQAVDPAAVADPEGPGRFAVFTCPLSAVSAFQFYRGAPVDISRAKSEPVTADGENYWDWNAVLDYGTGLSQFVQTRDSELELEFEVLPRG